MGLSRFIAALGLVSARQWVFERLWTGDQSDYGLNFTGGSQILRVKLATY